MISVRNLLYEVEDKILFENASLEIIAGQYRLIGNNGIGKSSLLNILTNNIKPQAGDVEVCQNYIYISQEPVLLNNVSVLTNVSFFNSRFKKEILKKLDSFGINKHKKIKTLSGGQKQLVYLEICLNSNYDLYLIDEPFNNLDKDRIEYVKEMINSKNNIIVIDHLDKFKFTPIYIEKRGLRCD